MSSEEKQNSSIFGKIKDFSLMSRELVVTGILLLFLIYPETLPKWLCAAGVKDLTAFNMSVSPQCFVANNLSTELGLANATGIPRQSADSAVTGLAPAPVEAKASSVPAELTRAVSNAEVYTPDLLPKMGWIFLGHVDKDKSGWTDKSSQTTNASWPVASGDKINVVDDVYVRALTNDTWRSRAPIVSVAKVGNELQVEDIQLNAAKIGGFYVWAKVNLAVQ